MAGRKAFGGASSPKWRVFLIVIASTFMAAYSMAGSLSPSGCTNIQNQPVRHSIEYGQAIQGTFNNFDGTSGCISCHTSPQEAPPTGGLDLTPGFSWSNLVNVPSADDPTLTYVVPNHPEQSLLFVKLNCDNPTEGERMPRGFNPLTPEQQATIYDWIAAGAPINTTDDLFRGTFDIRGFDQ